MTASGTFFLLVFLLLSSGCKKEFPTPQAYSPTPSLIPVDPVHPVYKNDSNLRFAPTVGNLLVPRSGLAAAVSGDKILVAGGIGLQGVSNLVEIFDPNDLLRQTASLSQPRFNLSGIGLGDLGFFAGGKINPYVVEYSSRVDIYRNSTRSWTVAELKTARSDMAVATLGTKVFFAGGISDDNIYSATVDIYDTLTHLWSEARLHSARSEIGAAVAGNKLLFYGGRTLVGPSGDVDIFDGDTGKWSVKQSSNPQFGCSGISVDGKAYFVGAGPGLLTAYLQIFDEDLQQDSMLLSEGKMSIQLASSSGKIYMFGGMVSWFNHSTLIEIFDPVTRELTLNDMGGDLLKSAVISFKDYIYFFGGTVYGGDYQIGSIFKFKP